jgi:hypothetical protein
MEKETQDKSQGSIFVRLAYGYVGKTKDTSKMTPKQVIEEFLKSKGVSSPKEFFDKKFKGEKEAPKQDNNRKQKQLDIINKSNPMRDDYHTGIRRIDDIKTFAEAMQDDESFVYGDYEREDAERDLKRGKVVVYSSKPIGQGGFVSTSQNMARDYAGNGKIYSQEMNIDDIAWVNGDEGQVAIVENKATNSKPKANKKQDLKDFVKEQLNVDLDTNQDGMFGKRNILYAEIPQHKEIEVVGFLKKKGYNVENHMKNRYWIYLK